MGGRWPGRVYRVGAEPDPRFSFANERTFLAWIRTSLALLATGIAAEAFLPESAGAGRTVLAATFVGLAAVMSAAAFVRWMAAERALRLGEALPGPGLAPVLAGGVAVLVPCERHRRQSPAV